jgi:hypothetical protein
LQGHAKLRVNRSHTGDLLRNRQNF